MNIIKKLFVNGKWSKLSKDALADDVSNSLLPSATAEDEGKVVSVTETGEYGLSTVESGLPVATSEDAGKVVAVDDSGEYELAEVSRPLVVNIIFQANDDTFTADKTYAEIKEAIKEGQQVVATVTRTGGEGPAIIWTAFLRYEFYNSDVYDSLKFYTFEPQVHTAAYSDRVIFRTITVTSSNVWSGTYITIATS